MIIQRFLIYSSVFLALTTGVQTVRVHILKAEAAKAAQNHAEAISEALEKQSKELSDQTIIERKAKEDRERQVQILTSKLKNMEDYHARLAPVLRLYINGMLDRASQPAGMVPAGSEAPSGIVTIQGRINSG